MFDETKTKNVRRWFVVCKQYQPYPLTEIRRELQQQRNDRGEHDGDEFDVKERHLEPTDFEVGRHLIDLGRLAEFQIHQVVKPELARWVFKLAGLYYWGHPTELRRFYVPLNSAAVTDMEQNAYRFFFVPEDKLLDFWFEDAPELGDDEKRSTLARQTDSIRLLTGDDVRIGFNSFYSILANSIRRAEDVSDDSPVLKAAAAAVLDAAVICRDADIPFDDQVESDWTFARLDYTNRLAGEIATECRAWQSGVVAEVEWSCNYGIMLRRIRDGFDDYEKFHAPTQDRRFLIGTVLKDLLLDETDNIEALRLIRIILERDKNDPPTGTDTLPFVECNGVDILFRLRFS